MLRIIIFNISSIDIFIIVTIIFTIFNFNKALSSNIHNYLIATQVV